MVSQGIESGSVPHIDAAWHALDVPQTSHCRVWMAFHAVTHKEVQTALTFSFCEHVSTSALRQNSVCSVPLKE